MTTPTFTEPPAAPNRSMTNAAFVAAADAFVAWFATLYAELVAFVAWAVATAAQVASDAAAALTAAAAAVGGSSYMGRSTANLAVGTGAKAVTGLVGKAFANGDEATLIYAEDAEIRMWGVVSAANMGAGTMTVTVGAGDFAGTGTLANWIVVHRAFEGLLAATSAEIRAGATGVKALTPGGAKAASATVAAAYGGTVTLDLAAGKRQTLSAAGSFTLAAPTNCAPGDPIELEITHTAGGNVMAVNAAWKRRNGLGVLSTTNGHIDKLVGVVETVNGSNVATRVIYDVIRNPTS